MAEQIAFFELKIRPLLVERCYKCHSAERDRGRSANAENLRLLADFTCEGGQSNWRWDGWGMKHGLVRDGEVVNPDDDQSVVSMMLPAGRWTHVWSNRLAGVVRSPLMDQTAPMHFSIECAGGLHAGYSFIVDHAFHSERLAVQRMIAYELRQIVLAFSEKYRFSSS